MNHRIQVFTALAGVVAAMFAVPTACAVMAPSTAPHGHVVTNVYSTFAGTCQTSLNVVAGCACPAGST
eukprot:CAMPEP_0174860176 /NCGR_PEP_ID=MMETSP1114-20130205/48444_1 /TAXON_ID=312471 /ORGANISM="Neobodo designis, Strain CCAP 1951/1" /LENGTH=67 /DNA_ID=CAMNT_0016095147 /DNA_START=27 /DNA_END=227 /DNA_ORIENTATION=+